MARIYVAFHHDCVGNWSVPGGKPQTHIFHPDATISPEALHEQLAKYDSFFQRR